jgi:SPW repeat
MDATTPPRPIEPPKTVETPGNAGETLVDIANLYLGGFLSQAPTMLGFESGPENVNAHLVGVAIIGLAIAAIYAHLDLEEWLNLALGLWLIVSPWVLHFDSGVARDVHVVIGALVAGLAALELWIMHRRPREHVQYRRAS